MFTTYLLASFLLMNLVSSSMAFRRSLNVSDDPFMDSYIRTIVSMDQQSISLIPRMSDEEFLEFLVDDSRVNLNQYQSRNSIFSPDISRDKELVYNDRAEEEWEALMVAGPLSIQYLGNLMVISSKKDFSLRAANYTYEYIKHPDSFRGTLTQVSGDMFSALMFAHSSMDKIRLNIRQMPNQIKTVFKLITSSSDSMIKSMLPRTLSTIARLADDNAKIANTTKTDFQKLQRLLTEIIQASTITQSTHQSNISLIEEQRRNATHTEEVFRQNLETIKSEYDQSKDKIAELRRKYNDIMKQASEADPIIVTEEGNTNLLQVAANLVSPVLGAITCLVTKCNKPSVRVDNTKFENLLALSKEIRAELERAEEAHREHYQKYLTEQNALMQTINNMASLDLSKMNHQEIVDLLIKAIKEISEIEEQWARLTRFFSAISNRADSLQRIVVQDFVEFIGQAHQDGLLEEIVSREFFNEVVLPIVQSIELEAHLLYSMATTYYETSTQYMMNQIAGINKLVVLQTDSQRNDHLRQASSTALAISISVSALVRERHNEYQATIDARQEMYDNFINGASSQYLLN